MAVRLRSLSDLVLARATAKRLATTYTLTGVLNRHGLELMAPILGRFRKALRAADGGVVGRYRWAEGRQ